MKIKRNQPPTELDCRKVRIAVFLQPAEKEMRHPYAAARDLCSERTGDVFSLLQVDLFSHKLMERNDSSEDCAMGPAHISHMGRDYCHSVELA